MNASPHKPKVAFIGLGIMGQSMAGHLLAAGHPLSVYNRSPEKMAALVARGAQACTSVAQAAADAQVVTRTSTTPASRCSYRWPT